MAEKKVPFYRLILKPVWKGTGIEYMDIGITVEAPGVSRDSELFFVNLNTVSIPFCEIQNGMNLSDNRGALDYSVNYSEAGFIKKAHYLANRDTEGDLTIKYRILPRIQPENYKSSPYFDFVCEEGGANGAGLTFLPIIGEKETYDFSLKWDLSEMPEGSRGVWCLNEGDTLARCLGVEICFSYYAAGMLKSIEKENFGFYWFSDPPFPVEEAAGKIRDLFLFMAVFFKDNKEPYKVFARKNSFDGGGGTAAKRSYMFGYGQKKMHTVDSLLGLFAHEMVHNWPHLKDEPYGTATWYPEGMAEYYSIVLPYRAGIWTLEKSLEALNKKTDDYYSNTTRDLSNEEAAKLFWTDRRTQRIPYGRGLLYIINTDTQIRDASGGKRCVDDVVLEILSMPSGGRECGNETWLELVSRELGRDASPEFNDMAAGKLIEPLDGCFGGAFKAVPAMFEPENKETSESEGEKTGGALLKGCKWELSGKKDSKI